MKSIGLLVALALQAAQLPTMPTLLATVLRSRPDLVVLNPERDVQGEYTIAELRGFGHWPPWVVWDLDHDGRSVVAAVVVSGSVEHRTFGGLAVHSRQPTVVHWIEPLSTTPLYGVDIGEPKDAVVPLHCVE